MRRAELRCSCGATATFIDERGSYINSGGAPDAQGRVFLFERWVDDFHERHFGCRGVQQACDDHAETATTKEKP